MVCEFCEQEIPIGLAVCPHCGKPQGAPRQSGRQFLWMILAVVALLAIAVAQHYLFFRG